MSGNSSEPLAVDVLRRVKVNGETVLVSGAPLPPYHLPAVEVLRRVFAYYPINASAVAERTLKALRDEGYELVHRSERLPASSDLKLDGSVPE